MKIKVIDKSNNGVVKVRREPTTEELIARLFGFKKDFPSFPTIWK